ncbi:geranylgeranyl pyrophosphate synthase [Colletotrichum incanum]|nr:geranylgeranyl pyrophosphate synthase [Colletotrichum incanum]
MRFPYAPLEHSLPVMQSMILSSGTFTTLPVHIHRHEHQAITGSEALEKDWFKAFGKRPSSLGCRSSFGHLAALSLPEAIPERLPICAYIMDYMLYHDGGGKALIRSTMVTKLLELDPRGASQLLEEWKNYTAVCAQTVHLKFDTFSQYADHRYHEAAIPLVTISISCYQNLYFQIMSFSTGLFLNDHEAAHVAPVLRPLGMAMALVNDYYSFDKECALWEKQDSSSGNTLYNSVAYLMRESHLSVDAAKGALKDMIIDLEREFCRLRDDWLNSSEGISDRLKRYVCYAQFTAGGSAYWHANAPRYQSCPETRAQDHNGLLSPTTDAATTDDSGSTGYSCQSHLTADQVSRLGSISSYETTPPTAVSPVMEPYNYIKSLPQKGFRTKLALALNVWLQVPQKKMEVINNIISTLHSASLMLDDMQDRSPLRRGQPSAHMVFGESQTINTASYLITEAGQGLDIEWRESHTVPSEAEYLEMVDMKTGAMFQLLWRLMQGEAASTRRVMGRYFQVRDDYMNLNSPQYTQTKGFCEDLDECKMSLVMIFTLEVSNIVRKIVQMRSAGRQDRMMDEMKCLVLEEMKKHKALERTQAILQSLHTEILEIVRLLEVDTGVKNEILRMIVQALKV